jgi:hypothetical protein
MTCPARGLGGQRVTEEHDAVDVAVGHLGGTLDVAAVRPGGRPLDGQPRRLAAAFAGRAGPEQVEVRDVTVSATATAESVRRTLAESDGTGRPTVEDTLAGDATSGPATSDGGAGDEVAIDSMTGDEVTPSGVAGGRTGPEIHPVTCLLVRHGDGVDAADVLAAVQERTDAVPVLVLLDPDAAASTARTSRVRPHQQSVTLSRPSIHPPHQSSDGVPLHVP